jgi:hypothetical protein
MKTQCTRVCENAGVPHFYKCVYNSSVDRAPREFTLVHHV